MFSYGFIFLFIQFGLADEHIDTFSCSVEVKNEEWPRDCFLLLNSPRLSQREKNSLSTDLDDWCRLKSKELVVKELKPISKRALMPKNCSIIWEKNKKYQRFLRILMNKIE